MFPFSFEWVWDTAHVVFMGGLWYALIIIGLGLGYCISKAGEETDSEGEDLEHH